MFGEPKSGILQEFHAFDAEHFLWGLVWPQQTLLTGKFWQEK